MSGIDGDWSKPAAMAIPKEGYFEFERGRYGPVFPRTPACYGFSIIAKVKEGREDAIREHGKTIQAAIDRNAGVPRSTTSCTTLRWHALRHRRLVCTFSTRASSTPTSTSTPRTPCSCSARAASTTVFTNLEGFPEDWKENPDSFVKFVREHHFPSFLEYGEYPYVTADEIKKALRLKAAFSDMLDQMQ